jgi:hypothetical protein
MSIEETTFVASVIIAFSRAPSPAAARDRLAAASNYETTRAVLADIWSRSAPNDALTARWEMVLQFLRSDWMAARDLGLIAFAVAEGHRVAQEEAEREEREDAARRAN